MKTIIVPTDFSEHSGYALELALELASPMKSEVLLLHIIDLPPAISSLYFDDRKVEQLFSQAQQQAEEKLQEVKDKYPDKNLRTSILLCDITTMIPNEEKKLDTQLIIMGTTGASGFKEMIYGSNTEKIVRYAKTPVVAVPGPIKLAGIKHLLIPTNGKDTHPAFFNLLHKLQRLLNLKVHVLFINALHSLQNEKAVENELNDYAKDAGLEDYKVVVCRAITTEDGIADYIDVNHVDMVAITTHGRHGFNHLIHGSLAENLVNHLEVPVLTYNLEANRVK